MTISNDVAGGSPTSIVIANVSIVNNIAAQYVDPPPPFTFPAFFVSPVAAQDAFPGACALPGRSSLCFAVAICVRPPDTRFVGIVPVLTWLCTSTPLHFECFLSLCLWACAMS